MDDIVYSVAAWRDPADEWFLLSGQASGLRLSRDAGKTWSDAYASLGLEQQLPTMVVAYEPVSVELRKEEMAGIPAIFAGVPGGILSSQNAGESWQIARLPEPPPVISCLAISPNYQRDGIVIAGTVEDGVFRSSDRGRSWSRWNFGLLDLNVLALAISPHFADDETLFAGTETGIFRSTNGGRAWREVDFPLDLAPVLSLGISPCYQQDGLLFAGTETEGLFLSRDRGKTWEPASDLLTGQTINAVLVDQDPAGQSRCLALAEDMLVVSRDGGQTWAAWEKPIPPEASLSCVAAPDGLAEGSLLLAGTADGQVFWL